MFIIRQYLLAQVFVTPLALISTLLVVPASPSALLRDRIIETVIGAAVGIAVVLAPAALAPPQAGSGTGYDAGLTAFQPRPSFQRAGVPGPCRGTLDFPLNGRCGGGEFTIG